MTTLRLAVLLSGTGRTLDNLHDEIQAGRLAASIQVVASNVPGVLGLEKAERYGYPTVVSGTVAGINDGIAPFALDLICLCGFLKLYTPPKGLEKAVLNVHPSLIPAFCGDGFYGMRVHRAVKEKGVKVSGCTVHFANEVYDDGPIVVQKCVPLDDDDTPEDIAARVFQAECEAYPEAINRVADKGIHFFWNR